MKLILHSCPLSKAVKWLKGAKLRRQSTEGLDQEPLTEDDRNLRDAANWAPVKVIRQNVRSRSRHGERQGAFLQLRHEAQEAVEALPVVR